MEALEARALLTTTTSTVFVPSTPIAGPESPRIIEPKASAVTDPGSAAPNAVSASPAGSSSSTAGFQSSPDVNGPDPHSDSTDPNGSDPDTDPTDPSSPDRDRTNPQYKALMDQLNGLLANLDKLRGLEDAAQQAVANDNRAIQQNTGTLNAIRDAIAGVTAQETALADRIAALSPDTVPGDQMVAAYLEAQYDALQQREIGLNASEALYEQAIAAANQQLIFDQGVLDRLEVQDDQLVQQIQDLQAKIAITPRFLP